MLCFFTFSGAERIALPLVDNSGGNGYDKGIRKGRLESRAKGFLKLEVSDLKHSGKLSVWVTVISIVAAVVSIAVAVVLFFEKKKKDEEDLEHYLDCSIQ